MSKGCIWVSSLRSVLPHFAWLVFLESRQLSPWLSFVAWIDAWKIILISKDIFVNFHLRDRWLSHTNRKQDAYFEKQKLEKWLENCTSYHCCVTKLTCLGQHTFITADSMGLESMWHIQCLWLMLYHVSNHGCAWKGRHLNTQPEKVF